MALDSGTRLGPYKILAPLGAGGMGEVYRALDTRLDREVAVKVLPAGSMGDAAAETRFDREARAIAALNHPNVCSLFDVGHDGGRSFLVMELLDGETLAARLGRGPLDTLAVVDNGIALADALDIAHDRGLLHRDLKPANIFLTTRGVIKILDFGLSKAIEAADTVTRAADGVTRDGHAIGTVGYMSPEQLRGEPLDARSDLFSAGAVLYEMTTGARAFDGSTNAVVCAAILGETPVRPTQRVAGVPPALEATILKALEKHPDLRWPSAAELGRDLTRVRRLLVSGETERLPHRTDTTATRPSRGRIAVPMVLLAVGAVAFGLWWTRRGASPTEPITPPAVTVQQLTLSGDVNGGALSPDGKFVAFVRHDGESSLWIRQLPVEGEVEIVPKVPGRRYLSVSVTPDGTSVDFVTQEAGQPRPDLWRVGLLGGQSTKLIDGVWSAVGWATDGRRMAFVRRKPDEPEESVIIADADGTHERVLATRRDQRRFLNSALGGGIHRPSWSRDGKALLVQGLTRSDTKPPKITHELVIIDAASGEERRVVQVPDFGMLDAAWLDDRRAFINGSPSSSPPSIRLIDLMTETVVPVTQDVVPFIGVSVTADRSAAVTSRSETRTSVWVSDGEGRSLAEVIPASTAMPRLVSIADTGDLVYTAQTAKGSGVYLKRRDRPASLLVDEALIGRITPDGSTVVYRALNGGIVRINSDGSGSTRLVDGVNDDIALTGSSVLFVARRGDVPTLSSVPLGGGSVHQVLNKAVTPGTLVASPDGKTIQIGTGVLQGKVHTIFCELPDCTNQREVPVSPGLWSPDGKSLATVEPLEPAIWLQPVDGSPRRRFLKFENAKVDAIGFAWSQGGKFLVVTRVRSTSDMVLIRLIGLSAERWR